MPTAAAQSSAHQAALLFPSGRSLLLPSRPLVMGVLNITPDSFSDGGRWLEPERAIDRAVAMVSEGADLLDLGAESTRPGGGVYGRGAQPVTADQELRRLLPVLERIRQRISVPISVDTRKGAVAEAALQCGADLVNDISALSDPSLAEAVAESGCSVVLMHSRGPLSTMQADIDFQDVLGEVRAELEQAIQRAIAAGIRREQVLVDPGIGFGKTGRQNLQLLADLDGLHALGRPIVVGASRKSFIGEITGTPADDRLAGGLAAVAWAARHGAAVVRVHDILETVQFLGVWRAIADAAEGPA